MRRGAALAALLLAAGAVPHACARVAAAADLYAGDALAARTLNQIPFFDEPAAPETPAAPATPAAPETPATAVPDPGTEGEPAAPGTPTPPATETPAAPATPVPATPTTPPAEPTTPATPAEPETPAVPEDEEEEAPEEPTPLVPAPKPKPVPPPFPPPPRPPDLVPQNPAEPPEYEPAPAFNVPFKAFAPKAAPPPEAAAAPRDAAGREQSPGVANDALPTEDEEPEDANDLSTGAIAAISIGAVLVAMFAGFCAIRFCCAKKDKAPLYDMEAQLGNAGNTQQTATRRWASRHYNR